MAAGAEVTAAGAAGLGIGLGLGLAAASAYPYYGGYGYAPVGYYGGYDYGYGGGCYEVPRVRWTPWGYRRVLVTRCY
jgi:hypothetical protein